MSVYRRARIFLIIGRLLIGCVLLIIVAVMIGQEQALAENVKRLHLTDCAAPCWIGIRLGLTTEDRAQKLFGDVYPQQKPYFIMSNGTGGNLRAQTNSSSSDPSDIVIGIVLSDTDSATGLGMRDSAWMPGVGDALMLWGLPTCVYPEAPDTLRLHYIRGSDGLSVIDMVAKRNHFSPTQPIIYLLFYRAPSTFADRCTRSDATSWHGFARWR